ncbi:MAG: acyl-CoA/acyl-ACP dehydrogenase [Trueperaceae bacterium]|nr:acyl-CoA/acyl-ACP dehydrogenase [Trueperaceae bacterium]
MTSLTLGSSLPANGSTQQPFADFLDAFKSKLQHVFQGRADIDHLGTKRGLPPFVLREIMSTNPFSAFIPAKFGGRGGLPSESMALLSAASYEALGLSLMFGINYALFVQPVAKYGQEALKTSVFRRFLQEKAMGGLMITEPDFGSDALNMQTSYTEEFGEYHIQGTKHWGGLTGWADYWLVTAREQTPERGLKRDIDFFVCDMNDPRQHIDVEEVYENLGLYMIPYGRNKIDVHVPALHKLEPESTGIKMMLDLLHRSRIQFAGMGMGFLQRMLDEALAHCKTRFVGGKSLFEFDQVQDRLSRLQASFTICSALCMHGSENGGLEQDLSGRGLEANSIKTVVTDLMQEASQSLLQLVGAKGYRLNHIAGRATVDSRPFQIFEGSNDLLYTQIAESALKLMRRDKLSNLQKFIKQYPLTLRASEAFSDLFNVELDMQLPQRKLVDLGKVVSRLVTFDMVSNLGERGFRADLIKNSLSNLRQEVNNLFCTFQSDNLTTVVDDYEENSNWFTFAR